MSPEVFGVPGGLTGLKPRANPFRLVRALRRRKRGLLSYAAAVREMDLGESPDTTVSYIGYARKPDPTAGVPRPKAPA